MKVTHARSLSALSAVRSDFISEETMAPEEQQRKTLGNMTDKSLVVCALSWEV